MITEIYENKISIIHKTSDEFLDTAHLHTSLKLAYRLDKRAV